jgi:ABC-type branched-subunit amino acid transport system substrate-binding protein
MGWPSAATVAAEVLAEDAGRATPAVRIETGDSILRARSVGELAAEVDRALYFAADPNVVAVVGPGGSRQALQTAPIYRDAELPHIVPTTTSSRLRAAGAWTFTMAADDSLQGEFIGEFVAQRLGSRAPLLLYLPDEYGIGLASGTAVALHRRGIHLLDRIPVRPGSCSPSGPTPFDAVADAVARRGPDVVLLATRTPESACLIRALHRRAGPIRYVAGDGTLPDGGFAQRAGEGTDSLYIVAFWHPDRDDAGSRAFVTRFTATVGRPPRHDDAMFYDATMLLDAAVQAVGANRRKIRAYLTQLGQTLPPYRGVSGPIAFTQTAPRPLLMTRLRAGRPELVASP